MLRRMASLRCSSSSKNWIRERISDMSASPSWVGDSSPPSSRYTYLRPSPPVSDRSVPLITRLRTASLLSPRISAASLSVTLLVANLSPPRLSGHLVGILPLPTLAQALRSLPRGCVIRTCGGGGYYDARMHVYGGRGL